jgi:hypothetical protein
MSNFVMSYRGKEILELLCRDCDLSFDAAREFLENRTGTQFDPSAMYWASFPKVAGERDWCHKPGLVVWIAPSHDSARSQTGLERTADNQ